MPGTISSLTARVANYQTGPGTFVCWSGHVECLVVAGDPRMRALAVVRS